MYPSRSGKGGSYPVPDRSHARAALRMAARKDTKGSYSTVKRKVCSKHPGLAACRKGGKK